VDEGKPKAKHLPKSKNRFTKIGPFAAAAIRLLLFRQSAREVVTHSGHSGSTIRTLGMGRMWELVVKSSR
jgi:hypothetical protein